MAEEVREATARSTFRRQWSCWGRAEAPEKRNSANVVGIVAVGFTAENWRNGRMERAE
jgi:hypothetical protein